MTEEFEVGTKVMWKWGSGWARGRIAQRHNRRVQRQVGGTDAVGNGGDKEPAYLIEHEDGGRVLKSHSELKELS